jgi:hypothetical protein
MILDKTVIVSKLNPDAGSTTKEGYTTFSGFTFNGVPSAALRINIQPASPELTAFSDGQMFKTYKAFTLASGLVEGMRVTVSGTNDCFTVKGREKYDYGVGQHYEIVLIKEGR